MDDAGTASCRTWSAGENAHARRILLPRPVFLDEEGEHATRRVCLRRA